MSFTLATQEEIAKINPPLKPANHVYIRLDDTYWVVKYKKDSKDEEKRDCLAYLLGKDYANVAEVKLLSDEELQEIKKLAKLDEGSSKKNTFLVKAAGSYKVESLPARTLEKAVATELIFSVFIRRRDAHVDNREYVNGIPVFFDHQTAFLGEAPLADINEFFSQNMDYGRAGKWRVRELDEHLTMLTRGANKNFTGSYHYVDSIETFRKELDISTKELKNKLPSGWNKEVYKLGYAKKDSEKITEFLEGNLKTLNHDLEIMKNVIFDTAA